MQNSIKVPVVTLSTEDNTKLLEQFKRIINWNKDQSNVEQISQNPYLNHVIDPSFQGVNRLFMLSFENATGRVTYTNYCLPKVKIKD